MVAGVLFAMGTMLSWSLVPFLVRSLVGTLDPVTLTTFRLLVGGAMFALIARGRAPLYVMLRDTRTRTWILVGGLALAVNHALFAVGLQWTSPAAGVIAVQIQTVAASVLSWVLLGEVISMRKSGGIALVVAGIFIVGWNGQSLSELFASEQFWGNVAIVAAGLCWGVYAVCQRRLSHRPHHSGGRDPRALLAPFFLLAGAFSAPMALVMLEVRQPIVGATLISLTALTLLGTVGGYYCLSEAMSRLPVATAVTITNMSPLVVALLSIVVFRENLSIFTLAGGIIAVAGCLVTIRSDINRETPAPATARSGASIAR